MRQTRSTSARDQFVAGAGAVVIGLVLLGILVVEARSGTVTATLEPVVFPLDISGTYHAAGPRGTTGPGGVCLPEEPNAGCAPALLAVDLRVEGLPRLDRGAHYVVSLAQEPGDVLVLGPLSDEDGVHSLQIDMEHDARDHQRLLVTLEDRARPAIPEGRILYERPVSGGEPVDLDEEHSAAASEATGSVSLNEIGAVTVSTTVDLHVEGLQVEEGWLLRAWLHEADRSATYLGDLLPDPDMTGRASLEQRIERVRIADQELVSLSLEPAGSTIGDGPRGMPILAAAL